MRLKWIPLLLRFLLPENAFQWQETVEAEFKEEKEEVICGVICCSVERRN